MSYRSPSFFDSLLPGKEFQPNYETKKQKEARRKSFREGKNKPLLNQKIRVHRASYVDEMYFRGFVDLGIFKDEMVVCAPSEDSVECELVSLLMITFSEKEEEF